MPEQPRNLFPEPGASASQRKRDAIDRGLESDKVNYPDPATAPLGADAEAGGEASPRQPASAGAARPESAPRPNDPSPPPALIIDKNCYSPWLDPMLERHLEEKKIRTLVVTGGETDMCVLSTVLGAVDCGFRVILVDDAICSSSDRSHDDMRRMFSERYSQQISLCPLSSVEEQLAS